jgi:hypothetical protein
MLKRVVWWSTGAAMGFGSSLWVQRKVRRTVQQYTPDVVQQKVQDSARRIGPTMKAAVGEGRAAMREREQQLEAEVNGRVRRSPEAAEVPEWPERSRKD